VSDPLFAYSVAQPWVWAMFHLPPELALDVLSEPERLPLGLVGQPMLIHASAEMEREFAWDLVQLASGRRPPHPDDLPRGQLIGACIFIGRATSHGSAYYFGDHGWIVGPRVAFERPVKAGAPPQGGLWKPKEQKLLVTRDHVAPHKLRAPDPPPVVEIPGRLNSW
jgi:hypothetical protein